MEGTFTLAQPVFQTLQPAHIREAVSVVFVAQYAIHFHQRKLGLVHLRQVRLGDGAIVDNRPTGQLAGIFHAQAAQVAHQPVQRCPVRAHPFAPLFLETARLILNDVFQLFFIGHGQAEPGAITAQFRWNG